MIGIDKSSRHSHIVGRFGEYLVCNWLSRSGFEVCIVDHTGLDLIAYHVARDLRLGVSVKARSRLPGKEAESVYLFRGVKNAIEEGSVKSDREKLLEACKAFSCDPWIAIYAECDVYADLFLTSLENYDKKYRSSKNTEGWTMTKRRVEAYRADSDVRHLHIDFGAPNWWKRELVVGA